MPNYKQLFLQSLSQNQNDPKWEESDFGGIKIIANTKVGDVGQDFIESLCNEFKLSCEFPLNDKGERAKQSPWDIKIGGIEFELKTATEDVSGSFQFNHIRYHRSYDAVLCLGVAPNKLLFNIWSKSDIATGKAGNLVSMEKGANASYKLTKRHLALQSIHSFEKEIRDFISNFK